MSGNSVEGMERCQQYYDCGSYSGVGSSDIFYYCGGNGTSVIVYIATSYELQVPFGMIAQQLVACSS